MDSDNHALDNARAHLDEIVRMVGILNANTNVHHDDPDEYERTQQTFEDAQQEVYESALSVLVRDGWYAPNGDVTSEPEEYEILLSTGGPACRIYGTLTSGDPETAELQHQDWFKPWTSVNDLTDEQRAALLTFAQQFYFGEQH